MRKFVIDYVYDPLAGGIGGMIELNDDDEPVIYVSGGKTYKMHSYLTEQIGIDLWRAHLWQLIGIGYATKTRVAFEKGCARAFPHTGDLMKGTV